MGKKERRQRGFYVRARPQDFWPLPGGRLSYDRPLENLTVAPLQNIPQIRALSISSRGESPGANLCCCTRPRPVLSPLGFQRLGTHEEAGAKASLRTAWRRSAAWVRERSISVSSSRQVAMRSSTRSTMAACSVRGGSGTSVSVTVP